MTHPRRIRKANPTWDGDGVQGVGQPRGRRGKWIKGTGASKKIRSMLYPVMENQSPDDEDAYNFQFQIDTETHENKRRAVANIAKHMESMDEVKLQRLQEHLQDYGLAKPPALDEYDTQEAQTAVLGTGRRLAKSIKELTDHERLIAEMESDGEEPLPRTRTKLNELIGDVAHRQKEFTKSLGVFDTEYSAERALDGLRIVKLDNNFDGPSAYKIIGDQNPAMLNASLWAGNGNTKELLAQVVVDGWAQSSTGMIARNIQVSALIEFGILDARDFQVENGSSYRISSDLYDVYPEFWRGVTRGMYDDMQAELKKRGIDKVLLHRGMNITVPGKAFSEQSFKIDEAVTVQMNPLSSWADEPSTPVAFGNTVFSAWIDAEDIFTSAYTGLGCTSENEFVTLGGMYEATVTRIRGGIESDMIAKRRKKIVQVDEGENADWPKRTRDVSAADGKTPVAPEVHPRRIEKAKNPTWDGDGVQGVGQPRGGGGRWTDGPGIPSLGPKPARMSRKTENKNAPVKLDFPGRPSQKKVDELKPWMRENLTDDEAKYVGLLARLLQRRGVTQDPQVREDQADKYGMDSTRMIELERQLHEQLFPSGQKSETRVDTGDGVPVTNQQVKALEEMGAKKGIPEANPNAVMSSKGAQFKPARYAKAKYGPHKGKYVKVAWNGDVTEVDKQEVKDQKKASRIYWTEKLLTDRQTAEARSLAHRNAQNALRDAALADEAEKKKFKIRSAKAWAEKEGLDSSDSYWWGFFWNDPSLISAGDDQKEDTTIPMSVGLSAIMEREHMNPALLEGMLALPDVSQGAMRGRRPGAKRALDKDDEDRVDATAEQREDDPEWRKKNKKRLEDYDRRQRMAYERYKARYPKSKKTIAEFVNDKENQKGRIPGGGTTGLSKALNPSWDGDGVQGKGQTRGKGGRWSDTGARATSALTNALGEALEANAKETAGAKRQAGAKGPGVWDHKAKSIGLTHKVKKPQKGSVHQLAVGGTPVRKGKKSRTPEQAYYERNNGPTAIDNKRLKEIYEDRTKVTPEEHDLLTAAAGDVNFDGDAKITIRAVRHGGARRESTRNVLIKNLRTQLQQDFAKQNGLGEKGVGGQVRVNDGEKARAQNKKDNEKRVANNRNVYESIAKRREILRDFGDGAKAKCIFCGRAVTEKSISPERMKPGPIGGKYEKGNVAPAHASCNTKAGTAAQYKPDQYYADMLALFEKRYADKIAAGKLGFVFSKHRGKLKRKKA